MNNEIIRLSKISKIFNNNEKKETILVKSYNNTYTLKKSLNENIEEKWNESVEETLEEALNAAQHNGCSSIASPSINLGSKA